MPRTLTATIANVLIGDQTHTALAIPVLSLGFPKCVRIGFDRQESFADHIGTGRTKAEAPAIRDSI